MPIFSRICTHLLTRTQENKFEDAVLVKIANKWKILKHEKDDILDSTGLIGYIRNTVINTSTKMKILCFSFSFFFGGGGGYIYVMLTFKKQSKNF